MQTAAFSLARLRVGDPLGLAAMARCHHHRWLGLAAMTRWK